MVRKTPPWPFPLVNTVPVVIGSFRLLIFVYSGWLRADHFAIPKYFLSVPRHTGTAAATASISIVPVSGVVAQ